MAQVYRTSTLLEWRGKHVLEAQADLQMITGGKHSKGDSP